MVLYEAEGDAVLHREFSFAVILRVVVGEISRVRTADRGVDAFNVARFEAVFVT